jgi:cytochrome c-type biogenesis protein CcmH/NrfG
VLEPSSPEANYNLGAVLRRTGRPAEAVRALRTAYELSPRDPQVALELCLAHVEAGSAYSAREVFEQAGPVLRQQIGRDPRLQAVLDRPPEE